MALRKGHGKGAGVPRIEVLPPDELPDPLPAVADPLARRDDGTIADSLTARALGARGGLAKASKRQLLQGLGLAELAEADPFKRYWNYGEDFVKAHLIELARVCGGFVGPGPGSIVGTAGVQLAASRFYSDQGAKTGNPKMHEIASKLGDSSRQNLMAAYELARREGESRKDTTRSAFENLLDVAASAVDD